MEPPPTHRSKQGFRDASLYTYAFPDQNFARIPGYTGHIPGKRDDAVGKTMGTASHQSMTSSNATMHVTQSRTKRDNFYSRSCSDQVLQPKQSAHTFGHTAESDRRRTNYRSGSSLSNPREAIYTTNMTPGYSGFVPQTRDINGERGAVTTTLGIAMHDRSQEHKKLDKERARAERNNNRTLEKVSTYSGPSNKYDLNAMPMFDHSVYNTTTGVMKGCTKFMPQRRWINVSKTHGEWSKESAVVAKELMVVGRSPGKTQPTQSLQSTQDHSNWKFRNGAYGRM
eukprot:m.108513 g.108513  ORF g.108513 m.108513 type:complete len:283 (+) comp27887_c0_seq1:247-1095(+)